MQEEVEVPRSTKCGISLKWKLRNLKKKLESGDITETEAQQEISKLVSNGKIAIYDARLIDGILFRKDVHSATT